MKVFQIIVLLTCFAFAICDQNCAWTGCEGKLRRGIDVCDEYGKSIYTLETDDSDCGWTSEKVRCCEPTPSRPGCKWIGCYGVVYGSEYACNMEAGPGYVENDRIVAGWLICYECCKPESTDAIYTTRFRLLISLLLLTIDFEFN